MAQVINTNSLSLVAQSNLNRSQSALGSAIQRLSSGMRINSAKDDAAGMAISNRFTASITGLSRASHNANDGISLTQTTEGALSEVNENLQNIRRLAVQAANGTNSESDRKSIQAEIEARLAEINRISEQTEFNGVKVLSKEQTLSIQVGANSGETIEVKLGQINAGTLGMDEFDVTKVGGNKGTKATVGFELKGKDKDDATKDVTVALKQADIDQAKAAAFKDGSTGDIYIQTKADGTHSLVAVGKDKDGKDLYFNVATTFKAGNPTGTPVTADSLSIGAATAMTEDEIAAFKGPDLTKVVDDALAKVDDLRSSLGAAQNRFNSVISNLASAVNNLSESRSRILDADYATEVSNMSRANILQSAGTTVLAQANQVPQNVLTLLR